MDPQTAKRKGDFKDSTSRKMPKTAPSGGGGKKLSFAERMMAKMGHVEGAGLGKQGAGILNPIETKTRPQRAGLGAVREMTQQAKDEVRRAAERRGDEFEDSSEEERKARKRRQQRGAQQQGGADTSGAGSGASTPGFAKRRVKYRTAADIEQDADGLVVPNVLKSIIDATGKEARLLTSAAGLMAAAGAGSSKEEVEAEKLAKRARRELEAFADSWNELTERAKAIELEEERARVEVREQEEELAGLQDLVNAVEQLGAMSTLDSGTDAADQWDVIITALGNLHMTYASKLQGKILEEIAVSSIHPLFRRDIADWEPLADPTYLVSYLDRLRPLLSISIPDSLTSDENARRKRSTSPYESMLYKLWLPKVRYSITNDWDVYEPTNLISLIEAWKPLLPDFISDPLINTQIVHRLSSALQSWNPRASSKPKKAGRVPLPHTWLFPWLPYLSAYHTTPSSSTGLLADVYQKLQKPLSSWDITKGVVPDLTEWSHLLGSSMQHALVKHILPKLSRCLSLEFEVYPPAQDPVPLGVVMGWKDAFSPRAMAQLLIKQFFPKLLSTLHLWLTSDSPNYEEIQLWWESEGQHSLPEELNSLPEVDEMWDKGRAQIAAAIDLGHADRQRLQQPDVESEDESAAGSPGPESRGDRRAPEPMDEDVTLKDAVEEWCEGENLVLMPLREAEARTGQPLFRVSASATGKGGVTVRFQGELVLARKKRGGGGEAGGDVWEVVEVGPGLVRMSMGRTGG
jgi:tuftelin-interacting protein 11